MSPTPDDTRQEAAPATPVPVSTAKALGELGRDEVLRERFVTLLREAEALYQPGLVHRSAREEITGPIADALFRNAGVLRTVLRDGLAFDFLYRSKIARDLVLAPPAKSDHVFEPQTTKLLLLLSANRRQVVIGGAYGGDHALLAARAVSRTDGLVHAFEPDDEQLAMLQRNADQNQIANIRASSMGLWRSQTLLQVVGRDAYAHAVEARPDRVDGTPTFPAISLNAYGAENGINSLDVVMLDVEGAELPIFEGATKYLEQPVGQAPDLIYEIHRHYVDWSEGLEKTAIVRFLAARGYTSFAVRDFQSHVEMDGCKIELVPIGSAYLGGPAHGFNMVAVKDTAVLESHLIRYIENVSPKLLLHKDPALHHPTEWRNR